jgi:dihydroflavonol-4-reductase
MGSLEHPCKVFVTGGAGFIGFNLIRLLLRQGYHVKALVRSASSVKFLDGLDLEVVQGDLNDVRLSNAMQDCAALFHVAAHYSLWRADRERLYRDNVLGTKAILEAANHAGISRVVYTSSVAAIGAGSHGEVLDEAHQTPLEQLIGAYKKSKFMAEQVAFKAAKAGQDVVIVNPTSPIGSWDRKPTPTGDIILRFLRRQMPFYLHTGLNFIDVEDVAWGHVRALQRGQSGKRYILGHQNMTLKSLLDLLSALTGVPSPSMAISPKALRSIARSSASRTFGSLKGLAASGEPSLALTLIAFSRISSSRLNT